MTEQYPFDSEYVQDKFSTEAPKPKSQTKQFLKDAISQDDLQRYGDSKPTRIQVRAKLIHG